MQSENFAEPGAPDRIPDDLVEKYGREARKTVKHNLSRRSRLARRTRRASRVVRGNGSDLWQTTAVVFSLSVIAVWPKIGLTLAGAVVLMFTFSYVVARRVTRRKIDPSNDEISLF